MAKLLEERKVATADLGALLAKARTTSGSIAERADLTYRQGYSCVVNCVGCNTYRAPQTKRNE